MDENQLKRLRSLADEGYVNPYRMSRMEIIKYPDNRLTVSAMPVETVNTALRESIRQMLKLMYEHGGVGLAGPQVGLELCVIVMNTSGDPQQKNKERVFINPVITHYHGSVMSDEGCLSVPGVTGRVNRAERVVLHAFGLDGTEINEPFKGMDAIVLQHEYDHLSGILFIDKLVGS